MKNNSAKIFFTIILLTISTHVWSQNTLNFKIDYAQFAYDSTTNYLELYYLVSKSDLAINMVDNQKSVSALMQISLNEKGSGKLIADKKWRIQKQIDVTDSLQLKQALSGVLGFRILAGKYNLEVAVNDEFNESGSYKFNDEISVVPLYSSKPTISNIQLAQNIIQRSGKTESIFYKNNYEVIPNPSMIYEKTSPVLFYYCELYNLNSINAEKFKISSTLINSYGKIVKSKFREIGTKLNSRVEVGLINLIKFPTGTYNLVISIFDSLNSTGSQSSKKFYYYNPDMLDSASVNTNSNSFVGSLFGVMTNQECDDLFDRCRYISTGAEEERYLKITSLKGKRKFLFDFWKIRDPIRETEENELLSEFRKRIEFVDRRFSTISKKGYQTDRGRIYLINGPWDQIDRFASETNRKPYEIWYYNSLEGGVIFVFGDLTGYSDYELLHSTKRGELSDYSWERRIIQN